MLCSRAFLKLPRCFLFRLCDELKATALFLGLHICKHTQWGRAVWGSLLGDGSVLCPYFITSHWKEKSLWFLAALILFKAGVTDPRSHTLTSKIAPPQYECFMSHLLTLFRPRAVPTPREWSAIAKVWIFGCKCVLWLNQGRHSKPAVWSELSSLCEELSRN